MPKSNCVNKLKKEMQYHFDMFGQTPNFTILDRNEYTSALGFITSIPIILQNDNFTLAISIGDRYSEPLIGIDRYFQLNISQCERYRMKDENSEDSENISVNLNCTQIPYEPCNMSHFTTKIQKKYFSIIRMGAIQCINRKYLHENSLTLQGQITSWSFRYISIQFSACQNTSQQQSCAPQEEIESVLQSGHYNVYKSDYLTTLDHPDQPFHEVITLEFSSFSISTSKTISQRYKISQTITDQGLIWEQIQHQSNIQQSEWREINEFYNHQFLIAHFIRLDYKLTNNIRTYVKLQTILGKLGGIFQILIMILVIILRPIVENFMKLEMVNSLFNFSDSFQTQQHPNISKEKEMKIQINRTQNQNKNQDLSKNQINYKLNQSSIQAWLMIFGCNKSQKQKFIFAKNKVNKNLEIVNILRKLQEIKILQKMLLTNDQYIFLKKYKRKIDQNGFSKTCIKYNNQFNQKNQLENFNIDRKVNQSKSRLIIRHLKIYSKKKFLILVINSKKFIPQIMLKFKNLCRKHQKHDFEFVEE